MGSGTTRLLTVEEGGEGGVLREEVLSLAGGAVQDGGCCPGEGCCEGGECCP